MKLLNIVALNFLICFSLESVAQPLPDMSVTAGTGLGSMGMDQSYGPTELVALAAEAARLGRPLVGGEGPGPDLIDEFFMVPALPFWARAMNAFDNQVILPAIARVQGALPAGFFASYLTQPAMAALTRHRRVVFLGATGVAVVAVGGASHFVVLAATGAIFAVSATGKGVVSAGKWLMSKESSEDACVPNAGLTCR